MERSERRGQAMTAILDIHKALQSHTFLFGLSEAQLRTLAKVAEPVEFQDQQLIFTAEQRCDDLYLLLSGSVSIELDKKRFTVRIQALGAGDAFGWSALLEDHDTLFDVRTRERSSALRLNGVSLRAALQDDPALAAELFRRALHLATLRLHATEIRLGELCGVRITTAQEKAADAIRVLNKLIEICLDGELGYRTAAEHIHDPKLQGILTDYEKQRSRFANELHAEVERLGGTPSRSGSVAASLHRGWIALRSAIPGGNAEAIIAACETGEHAAYRSYETALKMDSLSSETRQVIDLQFRSIMRSSELLTNLRKELASGVPLSHV